MVAEYTIEGTGHFSSAEDNSGTATVDGANYALSGIACRLGIECCHEAEYAFDQALIPEEHPLWGPMRTEYTERTGRSHPKAYRIKLTVSAEELPNDEAVAYWHARAVREKEQHDAFSAETHAEATVQPEPAPLPRGAWIERARANAATYEAARGSPEALEAVRVAVREARAAYEAAPSWPLMIAWCGALHDLRENGTPGDTAWFECEIAVYDAEKRLRDQVDALRGKE